MEKLIVEFIENGIAKCEKEDGSFVEIDAAALPDGVKNGDTINTDGKKYEFAEEETAVKKKNMLDLQARLFGKKK